MTPPPGVGAVRLHRIRVPLLEPFVAAHGTEHDREVVLVEVVGDDGERGWGECVALSAPTYSSETTASSWAVLRDRLAPALLAGVPPTGPGTTPMAWTAVAGAVTDLHLRRTGRSLAHSIGGVRAEVATTAVIGRQPTIDALVERARRRHQEGHDSIKLKVAPGWAAEPLRAVRAALPGVVLAADANGSLAADDLAALLPVAADVDLAYLEQPLPAAAADELVELARRSPVPIALDESIGGRQDLEPFATGGAPFVLNLKPARVGGLDEALVVLAQVEALGWPVFVGGMLETGVGRALALAAASWSACTLPTDLGPSRRYFAADVTAPIELLPGGLLPVPAGPGLGVEPLPDRLAEVTVDRVELRP